MPETRTFKNPESEPRSDPETEAGAANDWKPIDLDATFEDLPRNRRPAAYAHRQRLARLAPYGM